MKDDPRNDPEISTWLDGESTSAEARRIERALAESPGLKRELDAMRKVRQMLRALPRVEAPDGLGERILAAAERQKLISRGGTHGHASTGTIGWRRILFIAAAGVMTVGAGLTVAWALWAHVPSETPATDGTAAGPRTDPSAGAAVVSASGTAGRTVSIPAPVGIEAGVRGGVLLVTIRTDDIPDTNRQVVEKVLRANQLVPEGRHATPDSLSWRVPVPRDRLDQVREDLTSLPSRVISIRDAGEDEVAGTLFSTTSDSDLSAEDLRSFRESAGIAGVSGVLDAKAVPAGAGSIAPEAGRIAGMIDAARPYLPGTALANGAGTDVSPSSGAGASGSARAVRPMIIRIVRGAPGAADLTAP